MIMNMILWIVVLVLLFVVILFLLLLLLPFILPLGLLFRVYGFSERIGLLIPISG